MTKMLRDFIQLRRSNHFYPVIKRKPRVPAQHRLRYATITTLSRGNQTERRKSKIDATNLSLIPFLQLLRSIIISSICASPTLLSISSASLRWMLYRFTISTEDRCHQERLPSLLRWMLKNTLYAHFCAGETRTEIRESLEKLKLLRYDGAILEYALEKAGSNTKVGRGGDQETIVGVHNSGDAIETWRRGILDTLNMVEPGSFVGLKWSGLGTQAFQRLKEKQMPTPVMAAAMDEVCRITAQKGVRLLPAAEESTVNEGIHAWSLALQRKHNMSSVQLTSQATKLGSNKTVTTDTIAEEAVVASVPARAVIYSTYQAYLKSTPERLLHDLAIASREGFTLGVKLVRGAYLASEPQRRLIWDTKEQTDAAYDIITKALLQRRVEDLYSLLPRYRKEQTSDPAEEKNEKSSTPDDVRIDEKYPDNQSEKNKWFSFPKVNLLLATHNKQSVLKAQKIQDANHTQDGSIPRTEVAFAQLQGMADELSCGLVAEKGVTPCDESNGSKAHVPWHPKVYKCLAWGTVEQCLTYLLRRADENKEAAARTEETKRAMTRELWRRIGI